MGRTTRCVTLDCKHNFCERCISNWICTSPNRDCPMCRKKLTIGEVKNGIRWGFKNKILVPAIENHYNLSQFSQQDQLTFSLVVGIHKYIPVDEKLIKIIIENSKYSQIIKNMFETMEKSKITIKRLLYFQNGSPPEHMMNYLIFI
jgi:hypothetical protein